MYLLYNNHLIRYCLNSHLIVFADSAAQLGLQPVLHSLFVQNHLAIVPRHKALSLQITIVCHIMEVHAMCKPMPCLYFLLQLLYFRGYIKLLGYLLSIYILHIFSFYYYQITYDYRLLKIFYISYF